MKRMVLYILTLCLCLGVLCGTAFCETESKISADEIFQTGRDALASGNYEKAMESFIKAAELGHARSLTNIGILYANGWGVEQSYETRVMKRRWTA